MTTDRTGMVVLDVNECMRRLAAHMPARWTARLHRRRRTDDLRLMPTKITGRSLS